MQINLKIIKLSSYDINTMITSTYRLHNKFLSNPPVMLVHLYVNIRLFRIRSVVCLVAFSQLPGCFVVSRKVDRHRSRICSSPLWQPQLSKVTHGSILLELQLVTDRMLCPPKKLCLWPQMHSIKAVLWTCDNSINLFTNKLWTLS